MSTCLVGIYWSNFRCKTLEILSIFLGWFVVVEAPYLKTGGTSQWNGNLAQNAEIITGKQWKEKNPMMIHLP